MATSDPITFAHPYDLVFRTVVGVLPGIGMEVVGSDPAEGIVRARTGMGLRSWGENVTVRLGSPDGGATTSMVIHSDLKFGLVAWGKHEKNFLAITQATTAALP